MTDTLSGFVSNVEDLELWEIKLKLRERLRGHWSRRGTEAIEELLSKGGSCLLLIDELSILLHRLGATPETAIQGVELVHWLRSLRQQFSGALSMVLGSSVGIGRIVSNLGASRALNDLRQIEVRPFDRDTARTFADSLLQSRGLRVSSEVLDSFLSHVGTFVPMFIQIMADALSKEARKQSVEATPELVAWCYKERVLGPEFRNHFEDYYERLSRYYTPEEARAAKRILRDLALSAVGIKRSQLHDAFVQELGSSADSERFDLLVAALENDFYVRAEDERFTFHNRWLQDWWRRHHALGS